MNSLKGKTVLVHHAWGKDKEQLQDVREKVSEGADFIRTVKQDADLQVETKWLRESAKLNELQSSLEAARAEADEKHQAASQKLKAQRLTLKENRGVHECLKQPLNWVTKRKVYLSTKFRNSYRKEGI